MQYSGSLHGRFGGCDKGRYYVNQHRFQFKEHLSFEKKYEPMTVLAR